jgi:hypothetical protein
VRVLYGEGVATHTGPESCGGGREAVGEALTGERIGQPLSRERIVIPDADRVLCLEGNTVRRVMRVPHRSGVVRDPGMCGRSLFGNREIFGVTTGRWPCGPHREGEEP